MKTSVRRTIRCKNPGKTEELQDLFMKVAEKYHVLPIDDRRAERFNAAIAGRPDLIADRTSLTVYPGMIGITENAFINVKNRSYTITADRRTADWRCEWGYYFPGQVAWRMDPLYESRQADHEYNFLDLNHTNIAASKPIAAANIRLSTSLY